MTSIISWLVVEVDTQLVAGSRDTGGQGGYVLPLVIGVVLLLSLISAALLGYIFTTMRVTQAAVGWADDTRAVDGALDYALQQWRLDDLLACAPSAPPVVHDDFDIYCERGPGDDVDPLDDPDPDTRVLDLTVEEHDGPIVGRARARVVDVVVGQRVPGARIEVCDWLIGKGANVASQSVRGCVNAP